MHKTPMIAAFALALGLAAEQTAPGAEPVLKLKEESMVIEYNAALDEAALRVEAESESALDRVEVRDPSLELVFQLAAEDKKGLALSGFHIESRELSPEELWQSYPEGSYDLRAHTVGGRTMRGHADLWHQLLPPAEILYPLEGAVNVPTSGLVVRWTSNPDAAGYRVELELDENDGLTVELPRGSNSFHVPDGLLASGAELKVEVAAIHRNGNRTLAEVHFTTL
jgi:hypothetical protein